MQVILFKNVERLGMQGEIVNVADGYFRNYLGPRGMAVKATDTSLKRLELKRKKLQAEAELQVSEADAVAKRLNGLELKFTRKSIDGQKLFGSVTDHDILEGLEKAGYPMERRQLLLNESFKTVGAHHVRVRLHTHVTADIKIMVEPEGGVPAETAPAPAAAPAAEPAEAPAAE